MNIHTIKNRYVGLVLSCLLLACSQNKQQHQHHDMSETDTSRHDHTAILPDTASLINITSAVSDDGTTEVLLFASDSLRTGYQDLYFKLTDQAGKPLNHVKLQLAPQMKMGMMAHSAPVVQPKEMEPVAGFFKAGVAFIMPSSKTSGHVWSIDVQATLDNTTVSHIQLPVVVSTAKKPTTVAFDAGSEGRFFLSLENAAFLQSGKQELIFLLNKVDKDQFPAAEGFELALTATMPDMGHKSKADQNASSIGAGEYRGELDLSMPGLWEIGVEVWKDGKIVSSEPIAFPVIINQ